jgi:hypothetical protein
MLNISAQWFYTERIETCLVKAVPAKEQQGYKPKKYTSIYRAILIKFLKNKLKKIV